LACQLNHRALASRAHGCSDSQSGPHNRRSRRRRVASMVLRKRRCCSNLSRANMRNGWSDPLALGGGDTNLYVYAGSGPTDFTDPFGLQRYDAAPQPKTQKVTAGCMGARLLETFFGSTGYPTVTLALNVEAVSVHKPAHSVILPCA